MQRRALQAIQDVHTADERLAIHWAMCASSHPFFVDVVAAVGRLVRLQGDVSQAQITRRVAETWGDRSTIHRAVRRLCRTLIHWGVLQETTTRGVYQVAAGTKAIKGTAAKLLLEAVLVGGKNTSAPVLELMRHSALFPFELKISTTELRAATEFQVERLGLDVDLIQISGT